MQDQPGPEQYGPPLEPDDLAPHRLRFLITPRWIALEIAVIAFTLACYFLLAPWQFARSSQHDVQQQEIAAAMAAGPASVGEVLSADRQPSSNAVWREVTATGHFDAGSQSYIRLRQDNAGQPAYEVVVGFVTNGGERLLVDRGYIPYAGVQTGEATPSVPAGTVTISGRVQQDQTDPRNRPPTQTPDGTTAYNAVTSAILTSANNAGPVLRGYVQLAEDAPGVLQAIALPEDNSRPFFSYAIQWLSFGAIAVLGFGYFVYREFLDPVDGEIYVAAQPKPEAAAGRVETAAARGARFDKSQLYDD